MDDVALFDLAGRVTFKPYAGLRGTAPERLTRLLVDRWKSSLQASAGSWSIVDGNRLDGFAALVPLAWDTRVLGMAAGRLELIVAGPYDRAQAIAATLVSQSLAAASRIPLLHVTSRVDAADDPAIHALEASGFQGVDALVTFGAAPQQLARPQRLDGIAVRSSNPRDIEAVAELASATFALGRFHSDPSIPPERARNVYREWARGCCGGSAADIVFVAVHGERVIGFIACRMIPDTISSLGHAVGTIPLIASKAEAQGRGVGAALIAAAAEWFIEQGAMTVEVGTQLRNRAAARLYERCGFRVTAGALTFRRLIPA